MRRDMDLIQASEQIGSVLMLPHLLCLPPRRAGASISQGGLASSRVPSWSWMLRQVMTATGRPCSKFSRCVTGGCSLLPIRAGDGRRWQRAGPQGPALPRVKSSMWPPPCQQISRLELVRCDSKTKLHHPFFLPLTFYHTHLFSQRLIASHISHRRYRRL